MNLSKPYRTALLGGVVSLGVLGAMGADCDSGTTTNENAQKFRITIENVSDNTTLAHSQGSSAVPVSPGVFVVHTQPNPLYTLNAVASPGLEDVAEDGDNDVLNTEAAGAPGVKLNTKIDGSFAGGPPLEPGEQLFIEVEVVPGDLFSFAMMFIQSNDGFYAPTGNGIPFFNGDTPRSGDITGEVFLYDAGTEVNEEPGTGPNQAPRQGAPNTGAIENSTVKLMSNVNDGFTYPATGAVLKVTLTPVP